MKRFILYAVFLLFSVPVFSQNTCEYVILRSNHYSKKHGIDTRMHVDIGNEYNHSLKGIVENGPLYSVRFNQPDGSVLSVKNEADFLNIISQYGFRLFESYPLTITGKTYIQYIFVRERTDKK